MCINSFKKVYNIQSVFQLIQDINMGVLIMYAGTS